MKEKKPEVKDPKVEEAILRLEILKSKGLMPVVVNDFKREQTVYYSEYNGFCGVLYYFNDLGGASEEWIDLARQFEKENNALVYHIIHQYTGFGELLNLLYVSDYPEEWADDRLDLKQNIAIVRCINLTYPDCSDTGSIGYRTLGGGIIRRA